MVKKQLSSKLLRLDSLYLIKLMIALMNIYEVNYFKDMTIFTVLSLI